MLPLSKQIQIACDIAKNSAARLAGVEPPRFEDNEKTIEELRARIAKTIDYLKGIPAGALEGSEERDVKVPAGERTLEFKGLAFLQRWAIPNVFFHVTTAYNILRHNGWTSENGIFLGKSIGPWASPRARVAQALSRGIKLNMTNHAQWR